MINNLNIPENTPLTIQLNDGTKTLSKEIIELVKGTAFNTMEVVLEIIGKDKSYLKEFYEISSYSSEQIEKILGVCKQNTNLEKEIT